MCARSSTAQTNVVTTADYRARVEDACAFLEGKSREWLETLRTEMTAAAGRSRRSRRPPSCAMWCSRWRARSPSTRKFERDRTLRVDPPRRRGARRPAGCAQPRRPAAHMECFDISHISGTYVVASMVHFTDGRPDKDQYRRFQIKSFIGNDDFRAMEEVVGRRYRRLNEEGKLLPDLVVIDGGRGQIAAALKAFVAIGVEPPALIGLAKKHETIIFPDERAPLNLPLGHPGLNLLQRLRDEAHRFANTYNADLRSK
jgi:excinuclease ABC subunit C